MPTRYPLLGRVKSPADVRTLTRDELRVLADEVRQRLIDVCSRTGGHIGAGLGVVELTVALHHVFDTPRDQLVWDVGHQGYPHKLLTGRDDRIETLRQEGGLSGFLKRSESPYDTFGAGHAATSISAALGIAAGRDLLGEDYKVVAIIGDGSLTSAWRTRAQQRRAFGPQPDRRAERQRDVDRAQRAPSRVTSTRSAEPDL
jgi:1-deoxy-D-xylulose-5-phosphate synthase